MNVTIKNEPVLKRLLWLDAVAGGVTAGLGLAFPAALTTLLGLPTNLILAIAAITLAYAILACTLAVQTPTSPTRLRVLVNANWVWTVVSGSLFLAYYARATPLGVAFLVAQILVVGGLAYLEGNQIVNKVYRPSEPA